MILLGVRWASLSESQDDRALRSTDVEIREISNRPGFCPRCALTVARAEDLPGHLGVCSGTT